MRRLSASCRSEPRHRIAQVWRRSLLERFHAEALLLRNKSGGNLFVSGKVLEHAGVASTPRYRPLANDTLLAAIEADAKKQAGA